MGCLALDWAAPSSWVTNAGRVSRGLEERPWRGRRVPAIAKPAIVASTHARCACAPKPQVSVARHRSFPRVTPFTRAVVRSSAVRSHLLKPLCSRSWKSSSKSPVWVGLGSRSCRGTPRGDRSDVRRRAYPSISGLRLKSRLTSTAQSGELSVRRTRSRARACCLQCARWSARASSSRRSRASRTSRSTRPRRSRSTTSATSATRASIRSRAASTRRCTAAGSGRCGSSPASARPRRRTSASATCSSTGRRASRPRSTCRR